MPSGLRLLFKPPPPQGPTKRQRGTPPGGGGLAWTPPWGSSAVKGSRSSIDKYIAKTNRLTASPPSPHRARRCRGARQLSAFKLLKAVKKTEECWA